MSSRFLAMNWWLVLGTLGLSPALAFPAAVLGPFALRLLAADPGSPMLDDAPQPLVPDHRTTEADSDRVEALSLFAAGRTHEQREEFADALRCYERALHRDPESPTIVQAIIPVAVRLKRYDEAVRYALMAGRLKGGVKDGNPLQLRQLGVYLREHGDYARAVAVYE